MWAAVAGNVSWTWRLMNSSSDQSVHQEGHDRVTGAGIVQRSSRPVLWPWFHHAPSPARTLVHCVRLCSLKPYQAADGREHEAEAGRILVPTDQRLLHAR